MKSIYAFAAAVLFAQLASAQVNDANRAAAVALFDQAEELMASRNYSAACTKYAESNKLDPQLGALIHLANCYEQNDQLASAWASWRDASEAAQRRGDPREQLARDRANALEPRLSKLVIEVPDGRRTEGLEIRIDGAELSQSAWGVQVPVDAGEHTIEASAPGRQKLVAKVSVGSSGAVQRYELDALHPEPAPVPEARVEPVRDARHDPRAPRSGQLQRTLGWVSGGAGVVALGAGVLFELQRSAKVRERSELCPDDRCTPDELKQIDSLNADVRRAATIETISFISAGVLFAGGATLLLTAPSDTRRPSAHVAVGPSVARRTVGVFAAGSW